MIIDRHVYVGPYVRCVRKTEEISVNVAGCVNPDCPCHHKRVNNSTKFCPACGQRIGLWQETYRQDAVNVNDLMDDALTEATPGVRSADDLVLLTPNEDRDPPQDFRVDLSGFLFDALDMTPAAEVAWLEQAFADELAKLRAAFGADAVSVRWGVLAWTT